MTKHRLAAPSWLAALAVTGMLAGLVGCSAAEPPNPTPDAPTSTARPSATNDSVYRPDAHLTPERHWINDPQRPFFLDGLWHYYYLYNADYPDGNGTSWYHVTSPDLIHWTDQGIAIPKYTTELGDIWTGTAVVDTEGVAGAGAGAVIALVTQQRDGVQRQSMFVSTDGGYSFEPSEDNPIMDNPGEPDWRDPRVMWDDVHGRWVMVLTEGTRLGFYVSSDLRTWEFASSFATEDLGTLECPDLFAMDVTGRPGDTRWVLLAGANGEAAGRTTGTAYWVGDWDGTSFVADPDAPRWLDHGPDYYAAVTWTDPRESESAQRQRRFASAWMNNWAYATNLPADAWAGGAHSIVRELRLVDSAAGLLLSSSPLAGLKDHATSLDGPQRVSAGTVADLPAPPDRAVRIRLTLRASGDVGEARLRVHAGDINYATVGFNFTDSVAFVARGNDSVAAGMPEVYRDIATVDVAEAGDTVRLDVVVDAGSVEVFLEPSGQSLTAVTYGNPGDNGLALEAVGGDIDVLDLEISRLQGGVTRMTSGAVDEAG